jgi:hypothetical protein
LGRRRQRAVIGPGDRFRLADWTNLPRGRALAEEHLSGYDDDGNAAAFESRADSDLQDPGELLGDAYKLAVDAALPKQVLRVGFLEVAPTDLLPRDVGGDGEHRHPTALGIEQAIDEVKVPRTAARRDDR